MNLSNLNKNYKVLMPFMLVIALLIGFAIGMAFKSMVIVGDANLIQTGQSPQNLKPLGDGVLWHGRKHTHVDWKQPYFSYMLNTDEDIAIANHEIKKGIIDTHAEDNKAHKGDIIYYSVELNKFWLVWMHGNTAHYPIEIKN